MAKKKEKISLSDLGVEDSNETPAEVAAKKEVITPSHISTEAGEIEVIKGEAVVEEKKSKSHKIARPTSGDGKDEYSEEVDISKIAKTPRKQKKDPIRNTLDNLYEMADEGIERTKKEMNAPGGRINEAKEAYITTKYAQLEKRAKRNKTVSDHIKKINEMMDTDPRFDDITEFERKGYILFQVAKDTKAGVDNAYFGIEEAPVSSTPRSSRDASKDIDSLTAKDDDNLDLMDEDVVTIGTNKGSSPMVPDLAFNDPEDEDKKEEKPKASTPTAKKEKKTDDDTLYISDDMEDDIDEDDYNLSTSVDQLSEDEVREIIKDYRDDLVQKLKLEKSDELEGFTVSSKPINLNRALVVGREDKRNSTITLTWPLQYSGKNIEMSTFSGEEIITLNPQTTSFETVAGLKKIFSTIYRHIVNANKPSFEVWLRQISDFDIDGLLFAIHAVNFKDTNYITYECPNPKCKKLFLEKKDIMDMVVFPNDEVKERFEKIRASEAVDSQFYKSHPRVINDKYAIGFVSASIYSNLFEPASLDDDFARQHQSVVSLLPNIDTIYLIDKKSKTLSPIDFGTDDKLSTTTMRKVKGIEAVFKTFTPDERAIVSTEAAKIATKFAQDKITYAIPATKCPTCGEHIPARPSNPLNILFTRAQLPTAAAYIPE
jgi:hypothetical protein